MQEPGQKAVFLLLPPFAPLIDSIRDPVGQPIRPIVISHHHPLSASACRLSLYSDFTAKALVDTAGWTTASTVRREVHNAAFVHRIAIHLCTKNVPLFSTKNVHLFTNGFGFSGNISSFL
jgi:hypothetical protein